MRSSKSTVVLELNLPNRTRQRQLPQTSYLVYCRPLDTTG